jgi:branched-subunit amino acid ABC-type transport system permease component
MIYAVAGLGVVLILRTRNVLNLGQGDLAPTGG